MPPDSTMCPMTLCRLQVSGLRGAVLRRIPSLIWGVLWLSTDEVTSDLKTVPLSCGENHKHSGFVTVYSWWESQALLFIHKHPQEIFPKGRFGLMLASPRDKEGDYNMWGVVCVWGRMHTCVPALTLFQGGHACYWGLCQHCTPIPGLSTILQDGKIKPSHLPHRTKP